MLISDIETNGLYEQVTRFHCATIQDYFTGLYTRYDESTFADYVKALEAEAAKPDGMIVGHNFIKYDIPVLDKLKRLYFGKRLNIPRKRVMDTLVMTRLVYSNVGDRDAGLLRSGILPGKMFGSHSLEAWGYRLGEMKGEYKTDFKRQLDDQGIEYVDGMEWLECNQAMEDYCEQDVRVTSKLFRKILEDLHYFNDQGEAIEAVRLEHAAAWTLAQMERNGFPFDVEGAEKLYCELAGRRSDLLVELIKTFGSWWAPKGGKSQFINPKNGKPIDYWSDGRPMPKVNYPKVGGILLKSGKKDTREYFEGAPYTPIEFVTFNPGSRAHLEKVLKEAGWVPTELTNTGAAKMDDEVLEFVKVADQKKQACINLVREFLEVTKVIGMLSEGDKAWLRYVRDDGCIHGSVNPNGAVTGRATHSHPNMGQVPSAKKKLGPACRALFGAIFARKRKGWELVVQLGSDASGLELRCLGHFGVPFDGGAYVDTVLNGDIHWVNGLAAGITPAGLERDKSNHDHDAYRDTAKTFIYAFLYGAGDGLVGSFVGGGKKEGKELKKNFMENTPAISGLRGALEEQLISEQKWNQATRKFDIKWKRRWIKGLDGRKIHVRSPHSALNSLLQSAGALVCKKWVVEVERLCQEAGFYHGWYDDDGKPGDFCFMAWVHDELQIACRTPEIAEEIAKICQQAIRLVGESFNFRCPLDTDYKIGPTWRECH